MKSSITRRRFLRRAGATGLALGAAGIAGAPYVIRAAGPIRLRAPRLGAGFSPLITEYLAAKRTDLKHGLDIDQATTYGSARDLHNDFVAGKLDLSTGPWEAFAHHYLRGVPTELACIITTGRMAAMFTGPKGPTSLEELRGRTLAAMQVSGMYLLTKHVLDTYSGLKLEQDITVRNAANPVATLSLVITRRADAALTSEPDLSLGLTRLPGSRILVNVGDYFKSHTGRVLPYMCLALRGDAVRRHPDLPQRVVATYDELFTLIDKNREEAAALAAKKTRMSAPALAASLESGRMRFTMRSMREARHRAEVQALADYMTDRGVFKRRIDKGFYSSFE